jgi:UDP-N-acetyl-D-glucosamine dehydrogenase
MKSGGRESVMGLGYVGLPLAVGCQAGFTVTGMVGVPAAAVNAGESYIGDIPVAFSSLWSNPGKIRATADFSTVRDLDTVNICVPAAAQAKDPDMSYINSACPDRKYFIRYAHVLESTTYPGTTDEVVLPLLRKTCAWADSFSAFQGRWMEIRNSTSNIPRSSAVQRPCTDWAGSPAALGPWVPVGPRLPGW